MKNLKHTAGKWTSEFCSNPNGRAYEIFRGVDHIASIKYMKRESEANAKLIAAAPELLQCLLKFMAEDINMPVSLISPQLREEIVNAVKKATE